MSSYKNYIGIDISKEWLDAAIYQPKVGKHLQYHFGNDIASLKKFKKQLREQSIKLNKESLVVFEHTGVYKTHLVNFLHTQGCSVCIESPFRIKRSLGIQRGKNDTIDADRIAEYGYLHESKLRIWANPRKSLLIIRDLLSNRDRLQKTIKLLSLPLKDFQKYYQRKDFALFQKVNSPLIEKAKESVKEIEKSIDSVLETDMSLKSQFDLVTSVPGVGRQIALYLLCFTNEFTLYSNGSQLSSYAGVVPFPYQSGSTVKGRSKVHPFANKKLKTLLHIAAVANLRSKNELKEYYDRKINEGKHKMSVINAIRNKIALRVAAVVARGTPYRKIKKELIVDPELYHVQGS